MLEKKNLFRTEIVLTVIFLFIGTSFIPSTGMMEKLSNFEDDDEFDQRIIELMELGHMPSLVTCIVKNNAMAWSNAYGKYKYYQKRSTSEDIIYPIASITKSFIATAIMQLNESKIIGLDDNVSEYLNFDLKNPDYQNVNITFRMLLAHQSSLADDVHHFNFYFFWLNYPMDNFREYFVPGGKIYCDKIWNDYPPGDNVRYCTTGFEILGYIIEKITNQSLEDYSQENIFKPLNMMNTSFYLSNFEKNRICGLYFWLIKLFNVSIYFPFPLIDRGLSAGGGLKTTVLDLSHYLIMHTNGGVYNSVRILKEESVEEMHKVQYPGYYDGKALHGLGWYSWTNTTTGEEYGGHMGSFPGAQALMHLRYSDSAGIIFFWNQNSNFLHYFNISRPVEIKARIEIEKALFEKADEI